jgi:N-acetylated-alpha-linked acidic dipeptidase
MKSCCLAVLFLFCANLLVAQGQTSKTDWEAKFRAIPSADRQREYMERLAARPHHVGSPYDKSNAEWLESTFRSWGFDTKIETFDVLFPTPKERLVEMVEPSKFVAKLQEPTVPGDPTSGQHSEQLPTYNAYSIDGDVAGPLVYVNYGIPEDYEQLDRLGISVKGAIVIARYGGSWRGIKPKLAGEKGAVGCIIYSDPRDDGFFHGDVFPTGPWRPKDGVQRGSVMDMPVYPGDPLTPGVGATASAKRLDIKDATTITKIPVLPISYADAQPLLAALKGPVAPYSWRGALPITYKIGPGPAKVHLKVKSNWDIKTIYDVITTIPGSEYPDEWVIRGNHQDAWVNGAEDPISGLVAEMEELRALGELLKQGWKPKRTIVYCVWDGEEEGLLGSTEWAEEHADALKQKAVAYINSDSNGRGYLGMSGSHSLEEFINGVARVIEDPEKKISVWKRNQLRRILNSRSEEERNELRSRPDLRIGALGSGSDYTAFIDHLGVPSLDLGYGGEDGGGIYHSIYDDIYWYTHFADTDFSYGRALSQTAGTAVIRLADADLLPYDFTEFSSTVRRYLDEIKRLLKGMQDQIKERNREITEGVFTATADPKENYVPPSPEDIPPYLNFAPLDNAVTTLTASAERYDKAVKQMMQSGTASSAVLIRNVNAKLIETERALTSSEGLPGRPWFKNLIYAPGLYTGYGVKTIPGVREAIEQKKWKDAEAETVRVARALENEASLIDSTAVELEKALGAQ